MRKAFFFFGILILTALSSTISIAAPATTTDAGMMFGGQWFEVNQSGTSTVNLSELPPIVEVYTATWCSNCVDVEHALDGIVNETGIQQYHIHRAINEAQDPLGSIDVDQRFYDRYGAMAPPVVVFNGSVIKVGSVTDAESLESEFTTLAQQNTDISGTSTFSWNKTGDTTGTASWALNLQDLNTPNGSTLVAYVWLVEHSANFEEGTNGLVDYPHIVRDIIELGEINLTANPPLTSGTSNIVLQSTWELAAYDGNDLSVHLIYQVNLPADVEEPEEILPSTTDSPEEGLPAASLFASISVIIGAALVRRD
ncbi:MAG TPA: hypothetical protein QF401_04620 [Candidatus Poseidoniaceae archaeon]|jgi:glutaredoxin|nr:hypothetical protein [Candidatus Poseidoniaceae archaeon]